MIDGAGVLSKKGEGSLPLQTLLLFPYIFSFSLKRGSIFLTPSPRTHVIAQKKDGYRSQGKGRRVSLGGKICSISCCAIYFASVYLEEEDEFDRFFQIDRGKTASAARKRTNVAPQTDATAFFLASVPILLLWLKGKANVIYYCHCSHYF